MRTLTTLTGNSQKLDGGAMFGNAPKALWTRWMEADEHNRIRLGCRALLVQEPNRNILIEAGIGAFFSPEMKTRFGVQEAQHVLLDSLAEHGLSHEDIDLVILTHLHFDHAGGLLSTWQPDSPPELLFPNAQFITGKRQWARAMNPHPRDRASYLADILEPLALSGRVILVDDDGKLPLLGPDWSFHFSDGHTPGQMLPEIAMPDGPVVFTGDLIPGAPWVHLPITMGYDRFPEGLIEEKEALLNDLLSRNGRIVLTHDPDIALGRVTKDAKGKFTLSETAAQVVGLAT
ncbi:MBL fold metallo-hydrolase [Photobacterium sp. TY1-4]|uniref:MBL fold metallo-hydrolase n=1 Tax=Photobacterium sp. TY1-4 TaxID=2899122 RepID=UPI0021BF664E|nr:MBL fold metallo-hydrolase [Photobacterium sp. TY1-4]UXI03403.1 MBL fold metallo-hydrolase [Photobacterium sp. TY1-4]